MLYKLGIVTAIQSAENIDIFFAGRFEKNLRENEGTDADHAKWAVAVWCECYGKEILGKPVNITYTPTATQSAPVVLPRSNTNAASPPDAGYIFSGEGTPDDPYQISDAGGLLALAWNVNAKKAEDGYKGKFFALTGDIDLKGRNWIPIGINGYFVNTPFGETIDTYYKDAVIFQGNFDGCGKK